MKYHLTITINTTKAFVTHDYETEVDSIDEAVQRMFEFHPNCTSMVICLVPMAPQGLHADKGDQDEKA